MPNLPRAVPSTRSAWLPAGYAVDGRDDPHRCANCKTAYGVSTIPCRNHPRYNPLTGRLRAETGENR